MMTETTATQMLEAAWGIIANAGNGDWTTQTPEWQDAAARWRDEYFGKQSPATAPLFPSEEGLP